MAGVYYIIPDKLWFDDTTSHLYGGTTPQTRIGATVKTEVVEEGATPTEVSEGSRIGNQTLFGDYQDISYLEGYVQGKNVKNLNEFFKMNIPLVRSNNCQYYKNQRLSGEIDHSLSITRDISLGQSDGVRNQSSYTPYNDRLSKIYSPVDYIKAGKYVLGYPIVTDNVIDFEHYNDPDALDSSYAGGYFRDGALEPLGIRNSFANTYSPDIRLTGIKGMFMPYHQEQGDLSDKKGSAILDNKYEIIQGAYDWFEDAQDLAVPENIFSRVGDKNFEGTTNNYMSLWGYVSDGIYTSSPFVDSSADEKYFAGKYRQLGSAASYSLLASSSNTLSQIGSRFKSANTGLILRPKYDSTVQTVFGTDSVAFTGLMRN
jgi:hypothetical protein